MKIGAEKHLCAKLYVASRLIVQAYGDYLSPLALTYPKYLVLLALDEKNDQTVGQLGEVLSLDSGTLSPLLQSLARQGYLKRKRRTFDERIVGNFITPLGRKACSEARKIAFQLFEKTGLSIEEWQNACSTVDDLVERCKNILNPDFSIKNQKLKKRKLYA